MWLLLYRMPGPFLHYLYMVVSGKCFKGGVMGMVSHHISDQFLIFCVSYKILWIKSFPLSRSTWRLFLPVMWALRAQLSGSIL